MQAFNYIGRREAALAAALMIASLVLFPLRSVARPDKSGDNPQTQSALAAVPFEGCYELKLGHWWPWGFGEESVFVTPPSRIRLLPERGTNGFEKDEFLLRALPRQKGQVPSRGGPSYWEVEPNNRIDLVWTDGFTGLTLELQKYGDDLTGWARPSFDSPRLIPRTARVTARRIACPAQ